MTSTCSSRRRTILCGASGLALVVGLFALVSPAQANCNAIPGVESSFDGALGTVNRPFASPGDVVGVSVPISSVPSETTASDLVVTVVFAPPNDGPRHAIVLAAAENCRALEEQLTTCRAELGVDAVVCRDQSTFAIEQIQTDTSDPRDRITFQFPDSAILVASGPGLAGPAAIAVTTVAEASSNGLPCGLNARERCLRPPVSGPSLIACIDELFAGDGSSPPNPGETFGHFTALPPANDYQKLCQGTTASSPCGNEKGPLNFTVDRAGNALIPINWKGVIAGAACGDLPQKEDAQDVVPTTARFIDAMFQVPAFANDPTPIEVPSSVFVRSFTMDGRALAPIFDAHVVLPPTSGVNVYGFADSCRSVVRIGRRSHGLGQCEGGSEAGAPCIEPGSCIEAPCSDTCGGGTCKVRCYEGRVPSARECDDDADCLEGEQCGPSLFEFRDRLPGGVGPISVPASVSGSDGHALHVAENVPLDGIQQTKQLIAFTVPEAMNGVSLNVDNDQGDEVLSIVDRRTGAKRNTKRSVARLEQPPFSYPVFTTKGDMVALIEPEGAPKEDANQDGDILDAILRVFRGTEEIDPPLGGGLHSTIVEPRVNGESLALAGNLLVYRTDEMSHVVVPASAVGQVFGNGASFQPSILSPSSSPVTNPAVAFTSDVDFGDPTTDHSDVYVSSLLTYHYGGEGLPYFWVDGPGYETIDGRRANGASSTPAFTRAGDALVFLSAASNLVPEDGNGRSDVFATNRFNSQVELMSATSDMRSGDGASFPYPAISGDGRYVAFWSTADDLVDGDTNQLADLFIRDRCWSQWQPVPDCQPTKRLMANTSGDGDWARRRPSLSFDGRFLAFATDANDLVADDHDDALDVFVYDRCLGAPDCIPHTERVSGGDVQPPGSGSHSARISSNGRFVAFVSERNNLVPGDTRAVSDVFVRDICTGVAGPCVPSTERVSIASDGTEGDGPSTEPAISEDGLMVAFTSAATTLLPGHADTNVCASVTGTSALGSCPDVFVRDRSSGLTDRVSVAYDGSQSNGASGAASISPDGRQIAFASTATNLAPVDPGYFHDTNGAPDVFVRTTFRDGPSRPQLGVYDVTTQDFVALVDGHCTVKEVEVAGDHVAFLRPESDEESCPTNGPRPNDADDNHDRDNNDFIVHLWSAGAGRVLNCHRAATALALSPEWLAALVDEDDQPGGGTRRVVEAHALTDSGSCDGWHKVGGEGLRAQTGEQVAVAGSIVAFVTFECAQGGSLKTSTCPAGGTDLNEDGDVDDRVLQLYDAKTQRLHPVKMEAQDFVLGTRFVAFRTPDGELWAYDFSGGVDSGCLLDTGRTATPCRFEACDPRVPYRVGDNTITFLSPKGADVVLDTFNERLAATQAGCDIPAIAGTRVRRRNPAPRASPIKEVAPVFKGLCTNTSAPCASDEACAGDADTAPGSCIVPPGNCVVELNRICDLAFAPQPTPTAQPCGSGGSCTPSPQSTPTPLVCGPDESCAATTGGGSTRGTCRLVQKNQDGTLRACRLDSNCEDGARCRDSEATPPLVNPLSGTSGGSSVFIGAGQCVERSNGSVHGSCTTDADCPTVAGPMTCQRTLIAATAADTDGDEILDPFDNCPSVPNPLQETFAPDDRIGIACQLGCPRVPLSDCAEADAGKARLALDVARHAGHPLVWKWRESHAAPQDFGDPTDGDAYALCLYDVSDPNHARLRLGLSVPPGGRWASKAGRFSYAGKRVSSGVTSVKLGKSGHASQIVVKGKGADLIRGALPLGAPVTAQLVNLGAGLCWEASYTHPRRSDGQGFLATND
jgi:Tol biopolymer transport system component